VLVVALQQVKTKDCSVNTQAQGYLPHLVMFGQGKYWIKVLTVFEQLNELHLNYINIGII